MNQSIKIPVLILGGGAGGFAAALALARESVRCVIVEPTPWLGGQLTSQAVPPDENPWIEGVDGVVSATRSFRRFRALVREYYKNNRRLTKQALRDPHLNPGGGWVSRLCFEPRVGQQVLMEMIEHWIGSGLITLLMGCEPIAAEVDGDMVRSVKLREIESGEAFEIEAGLVLEATETGDLYELADIEHSIGAEHRDVFGELHGREDRTDPMDQQAITWCFAMEHRPGENHVIDQPANYVFWRSYVPKLDPPWVGSWFSWSINCHDHKQSRDLSLIPWPDEPAGGAWELWRYRRIVDRSIYVDQQNAPPDVSLFNCVQMDYFQKPLLGVDREQRNKALEEARQQALCFFYWMQTEAPCHDGVGVGYPGLKLRGEELGSKDGFAMAPYIREPRRLTARTMLTEAHVGHAQRFAQGVPLIEGMEMVSGEPFVDSIGIGHYPIDLHPSTAMRNSLYIPASPFRIPLGALLPVRVRNVIAAGKALGVSHIANGCTRLHPVEWNIGESAGVLAAMCVQEKLEPAAVYESPERVRALQQRLTESGVPLRWPWEDA